MVYYRDFPVYFDYGPIHRTSHSNKARNGSSSSLISAICVWLVRNRNAGANKVNKKY